MSGLDAEQLDELEERVAELLEEPWDQGNGRPRELTLREALIVACGYARNNITEEIWAEIFDVDQSTISRYTTFLTPLIDKVTTEFRPSAEEAAEATRSAIALVDGTLWPCWSWSGERELWSVKLRRKIEGGFSGGPMRWPRRRGCGSSGIRAGCRRAGWPGGGVRRCARCRGRGARRRGRGRRARRSGTRRPGRSARRRGGRCG